MPWRSLFHDMVVFLSQEDKTYYAVAFFLSLAIGGCGWILYRQGPTLSAWWNSFRMKSRRLYVNVLELHENMTQILHVNTQTAKTLRELQKLMHDVHGRFEALHDEKLQTEFNTRLQAVEKLLERWDTALAQQMHGDLGNVIQTLERLCQLVRHHDDEDAANIRECRDLGRLCFSSLECLKLSFEQIPFPRLLYDTDVLLSVTPRSSLHEKNAGTTRIV